MSFTVGGEVSDTDPEIREKVTSSLQSPLQVRELEKRVSVSFEAGEKEAAKSLVPGYTFNLLTHSFLSSLGADQ